MHPNGVTAIDHIVLLSPDLDRTVKALGAARCATAPGTAGRTRRPADPADLLPLRCGDHRGRRFAGHHRRGPSSLWGITYLVTDIDETAAYFDGRTTRVKEAVQPGRRITTVHHQEFGMSVRTAMLSAPIVST